MTVHQILLAVHVVAGAVGLLLGPVVLVGETRRLVAGAADPTGRAGRGYHAAVLVVCLSAVVLVIGYRPELWWLVPVSAASYGLVLLARVAVARRFGGWARTWDHAWVHGLGGSYIALFTAFVVVALTVDGPVTGPAQLIPWLAPAAAGTALIEVWRRRLASALVRAPAGTSPARRA